MEFPPDEEQLDLQRQVDVLFEWSDREALRIVTKYFFQRGENEQREIPTDV